MNRAFIPLAAAATFVAVYQLTPVPAPAPVAAAKPRPDHPRDPPAVPVYYSGCNEVRAAGLAPLYRGDPGYRPEMDGDDDGIACEPHRKRG